MFTLFFRKPFDFGFKQERAKLATEKLVKGYCTEPIEEDSEEVFCGGLPSYVEKPFHTETWKTWMRMRYALIIKLKRDKGRFGWRLQAAWAQDWPRVKRLAFTE